jgi:hypothetical protein
VANPLDVVRFGAQGPVARFPFCAFGASAAYVHGRRPVALAATHRFGGGGVVFEVGRRVADTAASAAEEGTERLARCHSGRFGGAGGGRRARDASQTRRFGAGRGERRDVSLVSSFGFGRKFGVGESGRVESLRRGGPGGVVLRVRSTTRG